MSNLSNNPMQRNQIRDDQKQEVAFLENYLITILSGVFINILSMENIQEKNKAYDIWGLF